MSILVDWYDSTRKKNWYDLQMINVVEVIVAGHQLETLTRTFYSPGACTKISPDVSLSRLPSLSTSLLADCLWHLLKPRLVALRKYSEPAGIVIAHILTWRQAKNPRL
jgi:hypothetical protein